MCQHRGFAPITPPKGKSPLETLLCYFFVLTKKSKKGFLRILILEQGLGQGPILKEEGEDGIYDYGEYGGTWQCDDPGEEYVLDELEV